MHLVPSTDIAEEGAGAVDEDIIIRAERTHLATNRIFGEGHVLTVSGEASVISPRFPDLLLKLSSSNHPYTCDTSKPAGDQPHAVSSFWEVTPLRPPLE